MTYGRDQACHLRLLSAASLKFQTELEQHARQLYAEARDNAQACPSPVIARLRRETEPHDLGKLVVRLASLAAQTHTMMTANETTRFDGNTHASLPFTAPDSPNDGGGHAA